MPKNPYFEVEQVEQYLEYLSGNPGDLEKTVETHFFPVMQKIFFYHAYEVRPQVDFAERRFPFECVDVLGGRRRILVHFSFTHAQASVLPHFALTWGDDQSLDEYPNLLVVQNRATDASLKRIKDARAHWISVLDFNGLSSFARDGFEQQLRREGSVYATLVREMMESLAVKIAEGRIALEELEWREVERLVGTVLQGLGFKCLVTPSARDKGRDLLVCDISRDGVAWYNIEIKHWRDRSVDARSVHYCLEVALREGRRGALLLSTGGIAPAAFRARAEVHQDFMRLADQSKIVTSCRYFTKRMSGLWAEELPVRRVLFEDTV